MLRAQASAPALRPEQAGLGVSLAVAEDSQARLGRFERALVWIRSSALLVWGIVLYFDGGFRALDVPTVSFLLSFGYMELLHAHLRRTRNMARTTLVAAAGDSMLAFIMCMNHGGIHSVFVPYFYLTMVAAAFRFGARNSVRVLGLNFALIAILLLRSVANGESVEPFLFTAQYLVIAFSLGAMLSNWAASNLSIAVNHSTALEVERDRSNQLLRRLINAQEEERKALAEDLHDRMGEGLFSIGHGIDACLAGDIQSGIRKRLQDVRRVLTDCNSDLRSYLNELRPNVLDELGLCEALSEYVESLRPVVPFRIETQLDPGLTSWRSRADAMLFRLIQEAILNARKHAGAKKVSVRLFRTEGRVVLEIADDGAGFDVAAVPLGHFGLLTMRERAAVSGGKMKVTSAPGSGTIVRVEFKS